MKLKALSLMLLSLVLALSAYTQSLPLDTNTLPADFKPNDFDVVFTTLGRAKVGTAKGEFETTEQYNARKNLQINLGNNQTVESSLYFLYPASNLAKYDADAQEFTVKIPTEYFYKLNPSSLYQAANQKRYQTVEVKEPLITNDGTSIGTNAYGAQVTITKSTVFNRRLIFTNFKEAETDESASTEPYIQIRFNAPLEIAEKTKSNLAVLYITKLVDEYYGATTSLQEATLNKPKEVLINKLYLYGSISEIWLVDKINRTVLSKLKPTDGFFINSNLLVKGKLLSKPLPEYPEQARAVRALGTVNVQVVIDEYGNVISATAVSGHPYLKSAAEAAALKAKFSPTIQGGKPIKNKSVIVYNFSAL